MIKRFCLWFFVTVCSWLAALFISWWLLAQSNFFYAFWYQVLDIDQHIAYYGPQNSFRHHFQVTTDAERKRLFTAIVDAIHRHGQGLAELSYHNASGKRLDTLLRKPEIVHLQDVARLVSWWTRLGLLAVLVWVVMTFFIWRQKSHPPLKKMLLGTLICLVIFTVVVLSLGAEKSFYWLHEWVFPSDHQWFFYYQESLMTTLLKAPDIFAGITLLWLLSSSLLFALALLFIKQISRR